MNPSTHQLAQLNIAELKYDIEGPEMADFVARIDEINQLGAEQPGFIWRMTEDVEGIFDPEKFIFNMTVWEDVASLMKFTFETAHVEVMRQRKKWFDKMKSSHFVMWWVPKGHLPSLKEGKEMLDKLEREGPSEEVFTFSSLKKMQKQE
ncbi:MAG: DUF3291 domain-containing protein [Bacteroidota bacterium]